MGKREITAEQFAARMKDRDPAFPIVVPGDAMFEDSVIVCGLTKREYFACHAPITVEDALSLIQSNDDFDASYDKVEKVLVRLRVSYADALIAALERKPE